jgi:hypothetical protein
MWSESIYNLDNQMHPYVPLGMFLIGKFCLLYLIGVDQNDSMIEFFQPSTGIIFKKSI